MQGGRQTSKLEARRKMRIFDVGEGRHFPSFVGCDMAMDYLGDLYYMCSKLGLKLARLVC